MLTVLIRTVAVYFVAVFSLKIMGKRQIGEMQISELTTAVLLSELIAAPVTDQSIPLIYSVAAVSMLVALEILISYLATRSGTVSRIFDNRPSIIIEKGKIRQDELKKLRFGINELISELRQKNVSDISEVDYAILEPNGKISVFPVNEDGMAFTLVCDGAYCFSAMSSARVSKKDIENELKKRGLGLSDVFLMTKSANGSFNVVKREI